MKHLLFLVHGIGHYNDNWAAKYKKLLTEEIPKGLNDGDGFSRQKLLDCLAETEIVGITYDDTIRKQLTSMQKPIESALSQMGSGVAEKINKLPQKIRGALNHYISDIIVYYLMDGHRDHIKTDVKEEILGALLNWKLDPQHKHGKMIMIAHSMGTIVTHDVMHELSTKENTFKPGNERLDALFMIANTSALLKTDYDPRASKTRLGSGADDPGNTHIYYDVSHKYDPICLLRPYSKYMRNDSEYDRYGIIELSHFLSEAIHSLEHYLRHPAVYLRIYWQLFGNEVVPASYFQSAIANFKEDQASSNVINKIRELLPQQLSQYGNLEYDGAGGLSINDIGSIIKLLIDMLANKEIEL